MKMDKTTHKEYIQELAAEEYRARQLKNKRLSDSQVLELKILQSVADKRGYNLNIVQMYQAFYEQRKNYDWCIKQIQDTIDSYQKYEEMLKSMK